VLDFCRAEGLDFILGAAPATTLHHHVAAPESSMELQQSDTGKLRRYAA
jgi:hypothetical protein